MINKEVNKNNDDLLYREWVPAGIIKKVLSSIILLFILLTITISALEPQTMIYLFIILGSASFFILLLYWNFRGLEIALSQNQIEVKYGKFNHKVVPLKEIIRCEIVKSTFRKYGGIGIRLGIDGSRAYTTNFGEAIKLTYQNKRPFVFSTRYPQKICNIINNLSN